MTTAEELQTAPVEQPRQFRISLLWQILIATLLAGLVPLAMLGYSALEGIRDASTNAKTVAADELSTLGEELLHAHAKPAATAVEELLADSVDDALSARLLPRTPEAFLAFYQLRQREIAYPTGLITQTVVKDEIVPLYREIAYIDAAGRERILIKDGALVPPAQLRDVSLPANTTYKTETYVAETRSLPAGEVYVSHLMAWHAATPLQPGGDVAQKFGQEGEKYGSYVGVIRFGTPVYTEQGQYDGMILLSLDVRHVFTTVIHITPKHGDSWVAWPEYSTGNYGYMWDDEGYLIVHPVIRRLRGLDENGVLMETYTPKMTAPEKDVRNFNMKVSNPNAKIIYEGALLGMSNNVINVSDSGVEKTNTYHPIRFTNGSYARSGFFGGVVVSTNSNDFSGPSDAVSASIADEQNNIANATWRIMLVALLILAAVALLLARNVTRPVLRLTDAARSMEQGELDSEALENLLNRRTEDEVTKLTQVFKQMAEKVQLREKNLREQIRELHIQIDEQKKQQQVTEIVDSDFFRSLQEQVAELRAAKANRVSQRS